MIYQGWSPIVCEEDNKQILVWKNAFITYHKAKNPAYLPYNSSYSDSPTKSLYKNALEP